MTTQKVLIFDFDGTIVDSGWEIFKILNKILPRFGIEKIKESEVNKFRSLSAKELLKEFNVPIYKIPFIYLKFKKEYSMIIAQIKPIPGIEKVLKEIHEKGIIMHIVSSNSEDNIRDYLNQNKLDYFNIVKGRSGLFGKEKAIKNILKSEKLVSENVIYVGDETRDIEAARKAGVKSAAVVWGFNIQEVLKRENPDFLLSKPEELLLL